MENKTCILLILLYPSRMPNFSKTCNEVHFGGVLCSYCFVPLWFQFWVFRENDIATSTFAPLDLLMKTLYGVGVLVVAWEVQEKT